MELFLQLIRGIQRLKQRTMMPKKMSYDDRKKKKSKDDESTEYEVFKESLRGKEDVSHLNLKLIVRCLINLEVLVLVQELKR